MSHDKRTHTHTQQDDRRRVIDAIYCRCVAIRPCVIMILQWYRIVRVCECVCAYDDDVIGCGGGRDGGDKFGTGRTSGGSVSRAGRRTPSRRRRFTVVRTFSSGRPPRHTWTAT